jgi:hypothetical protein
MNMKDAYSIRAEIKGTVSLSYADTDTQAIKLAQTLDADYAEVTDPTGAMVWDSETGRHEGGY